MDFRRPIEAVIPDAQGRLLATLATTTRELNLRTLAQLSGVSLAHAARLVPRLVELGIVERREVPPAVLVSLVREHVAARAIIALAEVRHTFLEEMRTSAQRLEPAPVNVTLFGSFARGEDEVTSDVDVVVVRPRAIAEDDPTWADSIADWEAYVRRASGNTVNRVEVIEDELPTLLKSGRAFWGTVLRDGLTMQGRPLAEIEATARA